MSSVDGYLKIKTKIDNTGVDKDIQILEDKIKRLQEANLDNFNQEKKLQEQVDKYEELINKVSEYKNKISQLQTMKNGNLVITNPSELAQLQMNLNEANIEISQQEKGMDKVYNKLRQIKQKQTENNKKISEYQEKIEQIQTDKIKTGVESIGKSLQGQIGKISKLAMAVVGVRSAWMGVRRIMSLVQQYNPQISADLEYMSYAIAQIFLPLVEKLVSIFYTILSYVNAIMTAWFGINLFSNSGVKNFQKMSKSAKEIKKSLAGFDEMNVLQDTSDSSKNNATPSTDLSKGLQGETPKWLQWIIDNKKLLLEIVGVITTIVGIVKFSEIIGSLINVKKIIQTIVGHIGNLAKGVVNLFKNAKALKALGIAVTLAGVAYTIQSIVNFIEDPSWEKFGDVLIGIGVTLSGIAILTGNWALGLAGLGTIIAGVVTKVLNQNTAIKDTKTAMKDLEQATKDLDNANQNYANSVDKAETAQRALEDAEKRNKLSGEELYNAVKNGTLDYKDMNNAQREVYKAYLDNIEAQKDMKEASEKLAEAKQNEKKASWENQLAIDAEKGKYDEYKNAVIEAFNNGELSADEARDYISKAMSGMSDDAKATFMTDIPNAISNGLDPNKYETWGSKLKRWFKRLGNEINELLNKNINPFAKKSYTATSAANPLPIGSPRMATGGIVYPKLATGAIVNVPNRGVNIGGAIAGEAGAEGVIPLTDQRAMETLGETIGRYITINANIVNSMNGRTISRQIQQIKNEENFAYNM